MLLINIINAAIFFISFGFYYYTLVICDEVDQNRWILCRGSHPFYFIRQKYLKKINYKNKWLLKINGHIHSYQHPLINLHYSPLMINTPHKHILLILAFLLPGLCMAVSPSLRDRVADLETRAEAGDSIAMFHLSTLFSCGFDSIPADSVRSVNLLRRSAEAGYPPAMNLLAVADMKSGNRESAIFWLRKAADADDAKAANNLAFLMLQDSTASPESDARAAQYLDFASRNGIPQAMATLGDLYAAGRGVARDSLQAEDLYLQAVSCGLRDAEVKLMAMNHQRYPFLSPHEALDRGLRAAHNGASTIAFRLFSQAADSIPRAMALLGDAYASARGVDYNHAKSIEWFLRAARAGDPSAQFILAEQLEIFPDLLAGEALPQDMLSPQYWYDRAADSGVTDAATAINHLFANPEPPQDATTH